MDKPSHKEILSYISLISGVVLLFTGLFLPPVGSIEATVLTASAQLLILAGALVGLKLSYDLKLQKLISDVKNEIDNEQTKS